MGRKADQQLVDRIAKELIKKNRMTMVIDRRKDKDVFVLFDGGLEQEDVRSMSIVTAEDFWNDGTVRGAIVKKVDSLRSSALGQIVGSTDGQAPDGGPRQTQVYEVDPKVYKTSTVTTPMRMLKRLSYLIVCARMYDLMIQNMESIEGHLSEPLVDDLR